MPALASIESAAMFPRLQKRGPIEAPVTGAVTTASTKRFHAYKSVAPLKHLALQAKAPGLPRFPRLQKRGPIEATLNLDETL